LTISITKSGILGTSQVKVSFKNSMFSFDLTLKQEFKVYDIL
jgi:hypothetical protein